MDPRAATDLNAELTAALDWWREAGVDSAFADAPRQWIVAPDALAPAVDPRDAGRFPAVKAPPPPMPSPTRAAIGGDPALWPQELAAFADWWRSEPALDLGQLRGRVPPRGPGDAALMVLVTEPEAADSEVLLSGPQGKLLGAMLAAMGVGAEQTYFASALPRHTPMADWVDLTAQGLGRVLHHHVALVRPQRIITFGRHLPPLLAPDRLESPLPGHSSAQTVPILAQWGHNDQRIPLLAARDLGSLLDRPIAKGHLWQHWLEWSCQ